MIRRVQGQLGLVYYDEVSLPRIIQSVYDEEQTDDPLAQAVAVVILAMGVYLQVVLALVGLVDGPDGCRKHNSLKHSIEVIPML